MFDTNQDSYKAFQNKVCERTHHLMAWVGSGLSASAGLPTWSLLRDKLCDSLEGKVRTLTQASETRTG